jgi:hypothetical protein
MTQLVSSSVLFFWLLSDCRFIWQETGTQVQSCLTTKSVESVPANTSDLREREMVQEWMKNKKYSREEILAVVRNNKWRKIKQYTVAETSTPPLTKRQKETLLYPIPINLMALLTTNELVAGAQDMWSYLNRQPTYD